MNQIKSKFKLEILIYTFIVIITISLALVGFVNKKPEQVIINEYKNGVRFSTNGYQIRDGIDGYYDKKYYTMYEIVQTKFDILNPVYSIVSAGKFSDQEVYIKTIYLQRTGIYDWKVLSYRDSLVKNYTFEKSLEIAKKYDVVKNNPDKDNIKNFEPISAYEIESNRISREKYLEKYLERIKKETELAEKIKNETPEERKIRNCKKAEDLNNSIKKFDEGFRVDSNGNEMDKGTIYLYKLSLPTYEKACNS